MARLSAPTTPGALNTGNHHIAACRLPTPHVASMAYMVVRTYESTQDKHAPTKAQAQLYHHTPHDCYQRGGDDDVHCMCMLMGVFHPR